MNPGQLESSHKVLSNPVKPLKKDAQNRTCCEPTKEPTNVARRAVCSVASNPSKENGKFS
jgi:hypothetical protein